MINIICEKKILNEAVIPALSAVSVKKTSEELDVKFITSSQKYPCFKNPQILSGWNELRQTFLIDFS